MSSCCVQNRIINNTMTVYHWSLLEVQYSRKLITFSDCFCLQGLAVSMTFLRANIIVCWFFFFNGKRNPPWMSKPAWQMSSGHLIKLNQTLKTFKSICNHAMVNLSWFWQKLTTKFPHLLCQISPKKILCKMHMISLMSVPVNSLIWKLISFDFIRQCTKVFHLWQLDLVLQ